MTTAYCRDLRQIAKETANELGFTDYLQEGVYVSISGPNYETPSESIFLRMCGADAVGMSTAPEVVVARHAGIRVLGEGNFLIIRISVKTILQVYNAHLEYDVQQTSE